MSASITSQTTAKIAKLARITDTPTDAFLEKYTHELNSILTYIDELRQVDTTNVLPTDGLRATTISALREDDVYVDSEIRTGILSLFPTRKGDLLELPGIFE
jgi:aspartyl/glutamyl-tRNA(Asn/Gln) amidotransferase C subunit